MMQKALAWTNGFTFLMATEHCRWDIANDYRIVPGDSDDDEEGEGEAGGVAKEDEEEGKS